MTAITIETALANLVRNDGKTGIAAFDYMLTALPLIHAADNATEVADGLIVAACDATGSRGKVTSEFPKGKANPNAIKANGYAMTAECVRLVRKAAKALDEGNERVADVVEGTIGHVRNWALFQQMLDADERVAKAGEDEAKLATAVHKAKADYIRATYGDNIADSFASLRRLLDKATANKAETTDETAAAEGEGEGATDVSAAAAVIGADDMATALLAKLGELSDDVALQLLEAVTAEVKARTAAEPVAKAA